MKFESILNRPAEWMTREGPDDDIVLTSRVRLARNLRRVPFPGWAKKAERQKSLETLKPAVDSLGVMEDAFSPELGELSAMEKQVLVERHLISREHAAKSSGSAVVMNRAQTLCVMINEEDHLRMQSILPGLQLQNAFEALDALDTELEGKLDYAYDQHWGYLTACPSNLGTGMRASAMLHLPALVLCNQINQVIQAVNKIGLAVRGIYGEGTEAMANLFQISNQTTLGESEKEIIDRLQQVISQVIGHEQNARKKLWNEQTDMLLDQIGRAYAVLRHAHIISSKEALNLLSMIRLGMEMNLFSTEYRALIDELFVEIQPAHLQIAIEKKLTPEERDKLRAENIRLKLKSLPEPAINRDAENLTEDDAQ